MGEKKNTNVEKSKGTTKIERETVQAIVIGRERLSTMGKKIKKEQVKMGDKVREMESFDATYERGIIEPPYDLEVLAMLPEISCILPQCIDAMKQNVEGFGYTLIPTISTVDDKAAQARVEADIKMANDFFKWVNFEMDWESLRKMMRGDLEAIGNGYFEELRNQKDEISGIEYVQGVSIKLTRLDKEETDYTIKSVGDGGEIVEIKRSKRFRRYVQHVDGKSIFFKELGDPRDIDKTSGLVISEETKAEKEASDEPIHWLQR